MANSTKRKIIEASKDIFAEHGYERATIKMICEKADVNIASVNYYFRTKKELYTDVLSELAESVISIMLDKLKTASEDIKDPKEFVRELVAILVLGVGEKADYFKCRDILHHELTTPSGAFDAIYELFIEPWLDCMKESFKRIVPNYPEEERTRWLFTILAQVHFLKNSTSVMTRFMSPDIYEKDNMEKMIDHITASVINGIKR
jgi:AcrR family transcriptional regulator